MGLGSWTTGEEFTDTEMKDAGPLPVHSEEVIELPKADQVSSEVFRPRHRRSNAILNEEKPFINREWSSAVRNENLPDKPVEKRARQNYQTGLVNNWWAEKLRADNVTPPDAVKVEPLPRATSDLLSEKAIAEKNSEIKVERSPEEMDEAYRNRIFPGRDREPLQDRVNRIESWRNKFLATLPLGSSPIERPNSPKRSTFPDAPVDTDVKKSKRSLESFYLVQEQDLKPSLPHRVINPDPLEPVKLEANDVWTSQLAKDHELVDTSYGWDYSSRERTAGNILEPSKTRSLTREKPYCNTELIGQQRQPLAEIKHNPTALPNPLRSHRPDATESVSSIEEHEETDEEIDDLTQDIETCSDSSSPDTSSYGSDDDFTMEDLEEDPHIAEENEDLKYEARLTWYKNFSPRPESPFPDFEPVENLKQVPAVEKWMQEHCPESTRSADISNQTDPDASHDIWAEAYLPLSILERDPRYANREVASPRLAQWILADRAVHPKRRGSRSPSRSEIVIQPAKRACLSDQDLLANFYRKVEKVHANLEGQDISVNF